VTHFYQDVLSFRIYERLGIYGLAEQLLAFTKKCNLRVYLRNTIAKGLLFRVFMILLIER